MVDRSAQQGNGARPRRKMRALSTRPVPDAVALLASLSLTACSYTSTESDATPDRTTTVAPPTSPTQEPTVSDDGTEVLVTIGDTTLQGRLRDNAAARDLAGRLPLTLAFRDLNAVEMTARLNPPLTMTGMPAGDDPEPGDIGWYAPSSDLVLYYGDVGYWNGIARLGAFDDAGIDLLAGGPGDVTVTITAAGG